MSFSPAPREELIGFCSAPWTDCITYADGALRACDRNDASFGNWQKGGLKRTWESDAFQEFRRAIREGRYPDRNCASCHNNGTQRTARSSLIGAYQIHYSVVRDFLGLAPEHHVGEISDLYRLLDLKKHSEFSAEKLRVYFRYLERFSEMHAGALARDEKLRKSVEKLRVIGESLEDYLGGVLRPRRVATFRQSQLQAKCTARCVMCVGKYTREIEIGPTMDGKYVDEAFAEPADITDFWCNGAEYLFFKEWKQVAMMLYREGVKMRNSTNGILLTEPNIDFMIDNDLLGFLTMSLDAATKETMESTRVRVNFEKNMDRIRYLLRRATEKRQTFEFVAAFVLMKRNLRELPAFVRLMKSLMPEGCTPKVYVLLQPLENFDIDGYRQFVHREHHSLLGDDELRRIFRETLEAERETGVHCTFYNQHLKDFVAAGMPIPKFFPRQSDVDSFIGQIEHNVPLWEPGELDVPALVRECGGDETEFRRLFLRSVREFCDRNGVIGETQRVFPGFAIKLKSLLPAYAHTLAMRALDEELERPAGAAPWPVRVSRYAVFREGTLVFGDATHKIGRLVRLHGGLALLHDGTVLLASRVHRLVTEELEGREPDVDYSWRRKFSLALGHAYVDVNALKNRLLRDVRSPLLWKLSVAYRRALSLLGLNVALHGHSGN
jgi:MoaA/NifB/PqqE/SkfB family radical SAM enzyme